MACGSVRISVASCAYRLDTKEGGTGMREIWPRVILPALCALLAASALALPRVPPASANGGTPAPSAEERARCANVPKGAWVLISIHQKSLTLYTGVEVQKRYAVATGTGDTPTPIGTFYVNNRFAGDLGGFGTRFLGLNVPWGQFGMHGTNKPRSIGSNASHGCVRMFVKDAEELYGKVPDGATVLIEGGPYGQLDTFLRPLRMGDRNSHVAAVQRRLFVLGYYDGSADGIFGRGTAAAVRAARKGLGLPAGESVDDAFYQAVGLILFE